MPRKAAYLELDDPDAMFAFFLAEKLGRTVAELDEMSWEEFMRWGVYFGRKAQEQQLANQQTQGRKR